jgi:DNA-binding CsgD family transcriptional regulator
VARSGLPPVTWPTASPHPLVAGLEREARGVGMLSTDPAAAKELLSEPSTVGRALSYALALRAAWGAAEAARLAGDSDVVDRLLAVEKEAIEVGLEPLLTRIQRSLRQAGVRRAARRAPDRSGLLTERERAVLDLLAGGATYTEVARRLGVGRSTVRRLLDNAHAKLGTVGRFAAVAAVPVD